MLLLFGSVVWVDVLQHFVEQLDGAAYLIAYVLEVVGFEGSAVTAELLPVFLLVLLGDGQELRVVGCLAVLLELLQQEGVGVVASQQYR